MKKLLCLILLAGIAGGAHAQKGFRAGVKGALNNTWLFNKNVSDAGDELDYKGSFGSQFGVMLIYNFNENAGISVEALAGKVNQKYTNRLTVNTGLDSLEVKFETKDVLKAIDVPLLFRYRTNGGVYFEVGPQFSFISGIESESEAISIVPALSVDRPDAGSMYTSAVIGLGYDVELAAKIYLNAGLRFAWGLSDVIDETKNKQLTGSLTYEPTNAAAGGIHVGVSYRITGK
jgi:hypothetical protein